MYFAATCDASWSNDPRSSILKGIHGFQIWSFRNFTYRAVFLAVLSRRICSVNPVGDMLWSQAEPHIRSFFSMLGQARRAQAAMHACGWQYRQGSLHCSSELSYKPNTYCIQNIMINTLQLAFSVSHGDCIPAWREHKLDNPLHGVSFHCNFAKKVFAFQNVSDWVKLQHPVQKTATFSSRSFRCR